MIRIPRLVVAGTHSGVGKTTVATALMAAFTRRGLRVQPFKIGPDFIDGSFHEAACGRPSRNLDGWMLSRQTNLQIFAGQTPWSRWDALPPHGRRPAADLAIIEGVMGLFDGHSATSESGSTGEMANWLSSPVLLVADASAMARSAAALVRGFETFDPDLDIAGVLFNRVGGSGHTAILSDAVRHSCRALPLGGLPLNENIRLPSRHLGLVMAAEALTPARLDELAAWIESHTDLAALLDLATKRAPVLHVPRVDNSPPSPPRVGIAVARDAAFCFYYPDNLDLLRASGAELVEFSPIADRALPADIGGVYLGGGYPELHATRLSANQSMLESIRRFAASGRPLYAECGGFMYLTEAIVDTDGREHPMAGIFPTRARMKPRLRALGYLEVEARSDFLWLRAGERVRGHEFRHSEIDPMPPAVGRCFQLTNGREAGAEGYTTASVLAGYAHLHFASAPQFARRFVEACQDR